MAYTWGSTTLNITEYSRMPGEMNFSEKMLIPNPSLSSRQSVMSGAGRGSKRVEISGHCTLAEFNAFETDMYAFTSRTFTFTEITGQADFTMTCIIQPNSLSLSRKIKPEKIYYSLIFMEV